METNESIKKYADDVKDLPLWIKYTLALSAILGTLGTLFGAWGTYVVVMSPESIKTITNGSNLENATSTVSISDMFNKATALDSVLERQDFLKKYIGSKIYGKGSVTEVSRSGSGYLVDISIAGQLVSCPLSDSEENEKRVLLLKGRTVNFTGIFPFTNIFDHGLAIDDCAF
jgi:hypothetical protein